MLSCTYEIDVQYVYIHEHIARTRPILVSTERVHIHTAQHKYTLLHNKKNANRKLEVYCTTQIHVLYKLIPIVLHAKKKSKNTTHTMCIYTVRRERDGDNETSAWTTYQMHTFGRDDVQRQQSTPPLE